MQAEAEEEAEKEEEEAEEGSEEGKEGETVEEEEGVNELSEEGHRLFTKHAAAINTKAVSFCLADLTHVETL